MKSVTAVIVCYQPEFAGLDRLLDSIGAQTDHVLVVDNHSKANVADWISAKRLPNVDCMVLDDNYGVAKAQNIGIAWAIKHSATHIVLFDQDSEPAADMVSRLLAGMESKQSEGHKVAAVGANYTDSNGQKASPFVKLKGFRLHRIRCDEDEIVAVDHLISSGCLISTDALKDIGLMTDSLFIDYVDTEWCLRAIHKGYAVFGVGSAHMLHGLGDGCVSLLGRTIPIHSSLRYYYLIRNGLWLLRQGWVPAAWKIMDSKRLFLIFIVYSFLIKPRFQNFKMMLLAIIHALTGKTGKLSNFGRMTD